MLVTAPKKNGKATLDLRDYNGFGQLVQIYRDGQRINFSYRPDNMRHSKEVTYPFKPALNRKTKYFWDGQNIILETNTSGEIKAVYLRGIQLIAQVIGEEPFYYLHNAHGDVVQRIAENGTSAPQYKYDAFGNEKEPKDTDPNPFRYCGEYFDFETEEIYLRNRMYNPSAGRFNQEDPAQVGDNWYIYCKNNPLAFIDPLGTDAIILTKPTESDVLDTLGQSHMSMIFEDAEGNWFYCSYLGNEMKCEPIEDTSVLTDMDALNKYLKDMGYVEADDKDFDQSAYIEGDFSASVEQARKYSEDIDLIDYEPNDFQKSVDELINEKYAGDAYGSEYSLLWNNCGHVAMLLFSMGITPDGESYGVLLAILIILQKTLTCLPSALFDVMSTFAKSKLPTTEDLK